MRGCDGVIVRSATKITAADLENPGKLRVIVRAGVGVDTIDVAAATRKGILVMNTPGGNTISTAEQTIALLMAVARHTAAADASVRAGKWGKIIGSQLAGKTIGVIGLGRIGREVARRAAGLDLKVDRLRPVPAARRGGAGRHRGGERPESLLPRCDFLTVHTPLTDETRDLIGAAEIAMMPKGARVINCARGGIINEEALAAALASGHLAGAALDVFVQEPPPADHPLLEAAQRRRHAAPRGLAPSRRSWPWPGRRRQLISDYLLRGVVGFAVNMPAVDRAEMDEMRLYVDLGRRLGLLLAQTSQGAIQKAKILYRGDVARRSTKLITAAFAAGLLEAHLEDVNIVNAGLMAAERGIEIVQQTSSQKGDFSTLVRVDLTTDKRVYSAAGTLFGNQYLRLVQLGDYHLDAYMDGVMLLFHHRDVPGPDRLHRHDLRQAERQHRPDDRGPADGRRRGDRGAEPRHARRPRRRSARCGRTRRSRTSPVVKLPPAGQMPPWFG